VVCWVVVCLRAALRTAVAALVIPVPFALLRLCQHRWEECWGFAGAVVLVSFLPASLQILLCLSLSPLSLPISPFPSLSVSLSPLQAFNGATPDAKKYPHVARYVSHIATYSEEERSGAKAVAGLSVSVGAAKAAAPSGGGGGKKAAAKEEEEEMGLDFLDDDEEDGGDKDGGDDDDDDFDPVEAAKKKAEEKKKAIKEAHNKSHKRPPVAKSRILFEVKPYDVETDLEALAAKIKALKLEGEFGTTSWEEKLANCEDDRCTLETGCRWGEGHIMEPVAFGLFKLIIQTIVEDDLVGSDDLIDMMMEKFENEIQSIDIAAFDKAS
jgi:elongation factor 1-beta